MLADSQSRLAPGRLVNDDLRREMEKANASISIDSGGGASLLKALVLADLILDWPVLRMVEIGVYRGRLLLPLALTMKWRGTGEVVGIDPYSAVAAEQYDDHKQSIDLRQWPHGIEWDRLYDEVQQNISRLGVESCCHIIRGRSSDVAATFPPSSIDLLHIDGNHDRAAVLRDAELYVPRVSPGGYVVLDDTVWPSVRPVFDDLNARYELVFQLFDGRGVTLDGTGGNDFAVFRIESPNGA
jgi:Methyltransferase domain